MSRVIKAVCLRMAGDRELGSVRSVAGTEVQDGSFERLGLAHGDAPVTPAVLTEKDRAQEAVERIATKASAAAAKMVADAEASAARMVADAEAAVEKLQLAAGDEGFRQGWEVGVAAGEMAGKELLQAAQAAYDEVSTQLETALADSRQRLADLALTVAERLVGRELQSFTPDDVLAMVERALEEIRDAGQCTVRVHPRDAAVVDERKRLLRRKATGMRAMNLVGDDTLDPGELIMETDRGILDGTITARMAAAREAWLEVKGKDDNHEC